TKTYGFFALMGGFRAKVTSLTGTQTDFPINGKGFLTLKDRLGIVLTPIAENDIADKAKADSLVKATAVLQSLWLAVQVFARAAQRLPATPLELATRGFVRCMVVTYYCWWL
ncbi:hypothetical protein EK21DRAFT_69596, partial [Setomelanomma holmii]